MNVYCRGVRGATTVDRNEAEAIVGATMELLTALTQANDLRPEDVASAIFTVTPDLDATYPAIAARKLGWTDVALLCATEIPVPNSLPHCIRVLIHWNTDKSQHDLRHIYLNEARSLRPDITGGSS